MRSTGIAPLTRAEVADLHECRCDVVRQALSTCLSLLADLYQRHTGSMFNVQFFDEGQALKLLHKAIETLKNADPFWQRMVENASGYLSLKEVVERDGLTDSVRERAVAAVDQLVDQWTLLVRYPDLAHTADSLAHSAVPATAG